jgi:hypothetical protein
VFDFRHKQLWERTPLLDIKRQRYRLFGINLTSR